MKSIVATIVVSLFLAGCVTRAPPPTSYGPVGSNPISKSTKREFRKNYEIGVSRTASVGEAIVAVKDYYVTVEELPGGLVPSQTFKLFRTDFNTDRPVLTGTEGVAIPISAEAVVNGRRYYVVQQQDQVGSVNLTHMLYVGEDGILLPNRLRVRVQFGALDETNELGPEMRLVPPNVTFSMANNKRNEVEAKGYVNYEIVFTGKSADQLNFVYREFSRDDLARQAFFQNLTYSAAEPMIRFRNLQIRVDRVSNEGIAYAVLQD